MPNDVRVGSAYVVFDARNEPLLQKLQQNKAAIREYAGLVAVEQRRVLQSFEQALPFTRSFTEERRQLRALNAAYSNHSRNIESQVRIANTAILSKRNAVEQYASVHTRAIEEELRRERRLQREKEQLARREARRLSDLSNRIRQHNEILRREGLAFDPRTGRYGASPEVHQAAIAEDRSRTERAREERFRQERRRFLADQQQARALQEQNLIFDRNRGVFRQTRLLERYTQAANRATGTTIGFDRSLTQITLTLLQYQLATAAITTVIAAFGAASFRSAANYEEAFVGVAKTVESTRDEFGRLTESGRRLEIGILELSSSIPVFSGELAGIASIAGQLGIEGTQNILTFTDVIARLGVSTNLSFQEAALGVARLGGVLGYERPLAIGSVITRLGNTFRTGEQQILNYSVRMAGAGRAATLTVDEILALGTAAASAGIQSEAGASAMQRVFLEVLSAVRAGGEELEVFARLAGTTAERFSQAWGEDPTGVILDILRGIRDSEGAIRDLEEVGLGGVRALRLLLSTAGEVEQVERALRLAREELILQRALVEESTYFFDIFNNELQRMYNNFDNIAVIIGEHNLPVLTDFIGRMNDLIETGKEFTAVFTTVGTILTGISLLFAGAFGVAGILGRLGILGARSIGSIRTLFGITGTLGVTGLLGGGLSNIFEDETGRIPRSFESDIELATRRNRIETQIIPELQVQINELNEELERNLERLGDPLTPDGPISDRIRTRNNEIGELIEDLKNRIISSREEIESINNEFINRAIVRDVSIEELRNRYNEYIQLRQEVLQQLTEAEQGTDLSLIRTRRNERDLLTELIGSFESAIRDRERVLTPEPRPPTRLSEEILQAYLDGLEAIREAERAEEQARIETARQATRDQLGELFEDYERYLQRRQFLQDAVTARNERLVELFPRTFRAIREGEITEQDIGEKTFANLQRVEDALLSWDQHLQNVENSTTKVSQAFGNMFQSFLNGSRDALTAIRHLISNLFNLSIQTLALRPLFSFLFGSSPFFASIFATGGFGIPVTPIPATNLSFVAGLPGLQHGGFHPGGLALVGERGPEIVDFRTPSRIYSNEDLGEAISGRGENIVFNFSPVIQSSDTEATRRVLAEILPAFERKIRGGIAQDLRRPSDLRRISGGRG